MVDLRINLGVSRPVLTDLSVRGDLDQVLAAIKLDAVDETEFDAMDRVGSGLRSRLARTTSASTVAATSCRSDASTTPVAGPTRRSWRTSLAAYE